MWIVRAAREVSAAAERDSVEAIAVAATSIKRMCPWCGYRGNI